MVKNLQKLYIRSLITRIKCIRNSTQCSYAANQLELKLTTNDKLILISNLSYYLNFIKLESFLLTKKKSLSFFFESSNLYISCLKCLYFNSILPIMDLSSDRINIIYRPYRYSQDVFFNLREKLLIQKASIWVLRVELFLWPNKFCWLKKNFPFCKLTNDILYTFNKTTFKNKFFFLIINFLLNGLV